MHAKVAFPKSRSTLRSKTFRPEAELLEDRLAPAIITVTGTGDTIAVDGVVTLREAITAANTHAVSGDAPAGTEFDTIKFNIPTSDPGFDAVKRAWSIKPSSALPTITDSV